jgi:hypothetical protein
MMPETTSTQQQPRGRGRPKSERGACEHVTVRLRADEVDQLRQLGKGTVADGIRALFVAHANSLTAHANQGLVAHGNSEQVHASSIQQPVPTSAVSQRVPVAPQREHLPVRVPPASRLPRSITSWSDDD